MVKFFGVAATIEKKKNFPALTQPIQIPQLSRLFGLKFL